MGLGQLQQKRLLKVAMREELTPTLGHWCDQTGRTAQAMLCGSMNGAYRGGGIQRRSTSVEAIRSCRPCLRRVKATIRKPINRISADRILDQ